MTKRREEGTLIFSKIQNTMFNNFLLIFLLSLLSFQPIYSQDAPTSQPSQEESSSEIPSSWKDLDEPLVETNEGSFFMEFVNMLFILCFVLGAAFLLFWSLKRLTSTRLQQANLTSEIKILEQRNLNQRSSVYLLQVMGRMILISESANGINKIADLTEEESSFRKILDSKSKKP